MCPCLSVYVLVSVSMCLPLCVYMCLSVCGSMPKPKKDGRCQQINFSFFLKPLLKQGCIYKIVNKKQTHTMRPLLLQQTAQAGIVWKGHYSIFTHTVLVYGPPRWPSGKASASRAEDPGSKSRLRRDFSGSSHTSDLKIGTPVATLPGAQRYRVSTGTGRPCVSILWLGEIESLICNFYLSVAARKIVWADPSLRYTHLLLGR